jgi:hypothetical protein
MCVGCSLFHRFTRLIADADPRTCNSLFAPSLDSLARKHDV